MTQLFRVALLGFSPHERTTLTGYFRMAANRVPRYEQVQLLNDADLMVADADHGPSEQLVVVTERLQDTVFVGTRSPAGAVAWLPRPLDALRVLRELDALVVARGGSGPTTAPRVRTILQPPRRTQPSTIEAAIAGQAAPAPTSAPSSAPTSAPESALTAAPTSVRASAPTSTAAPPPPLTLELPDLPEVVELDLPLPLLDEWADPRERGTADEAPVPDAASLQLRDPQPTAAVAPEPAAASEAAVAGPPQARAEPEPAAPPDAAAAPVAQPLAPSVAPSVAPPVAPSVPPSVPQPVPPRAPPARKSGTRKPPRPASAAPMPSPVALLVDDSEVALRFLQTRLARFGISCHGARNSAEALVMLGRLDPDFVFVDMELGEGSDLDGLALARRIKSETSTRVPQLPVFMVTAHHGQLDRVRATLAGCDALLGKPLADAELERLLARHGVERASTD